jgi:ferric-dicitrate binding protein FerR (iron transport regulator)
MDKTHRVEELIESQLFRDAIFIGNALSDDDLAILARRFELDIEDVKSAQLFLMSANRPTTEFEVDDQDMLLSRISTSIDDISDNQSQFIIPKNENAYSRYRKASIKSKWYGIAATLLIIVSFLFIIERFNEPTRVDQLSVSVVEKTTSKGQKLKIFLPDGSTATLNSGSKIHYPKQFESNSREVSIEGEVFFEVKSDSLKPFIVNVQDVTARVLGTSFNIDDSKDELTIALVTGRLAVEKQGQNRVNLTPGEMAVVNSIEPIEVKEFVYEDVIAWKDGVIVFKNATFEELIEKLENWYGVTISVKGTVDQDFHYTGKYDNYTLDEVLHGISFLKEFDYKINENQVEIIIN